MEFDDTNLNPCDMVCPEFFEPYVALRYPGLREFGPRRSSMHRFRFVAAAMSSCQVIKPLMSGLLTRMRTVSSDECLFYSQASVRVSF